MGQFQTIPVVAGFPAVLLADIDEVVTLVNSDSTNTVTLGHNVAVQVGDQASVPFGPSQVLTTDGSQRFFGVLSTTIAGTIVDVLKFPGVSQFTGSSPLAPSATPPSIATGVATAGNTVDLVGGTGNPNPNHLAIQLLTASIAPVLFGASPSAQNWQDQIQDSSGFPYLTAQVGLPSSGGICAPPVSQDLKGATVPKGKKLQLSNAGVSAGAVHVVSCTVVYYLVGAM